MNGHVERAKVYMEQAKIYGKNSFFICLLLKHTFFNKKKLIIGQKLHMKMNIFVFNTIYQILGRRNIISFFNQSYP